MFGQDSCVYNHIGDAADSNNVYAGIIESNNETFVLAYGNICVVLRKLGDCGEIIEEKPLLCDSIPKGLSGGSRALVETGIDEYLFAYTSFEGNLRNTELLKFNLNGDTLWTRKLSPFNVNIIYSVVKSPDGGFFLAGAGGPTNFTDDLQSLIMKVDQFGELEWFRLDDVYDNSLDLSLQLLSNENLLSTGLAPFGGDNTKARVRMLNQSGEVLWDKRYGVKDNGGCFIYEWNADSLLFTGMEFDKHWLAWMDYDGNMLSEAYGEYQLAYTTPIVNTDGTFVYPVLREYFGNQIYLQQYDKQFNQLWSQHLYVPEGEYTIVQDIARASDNGYFVTGVINQDVTWLVKTDENGITCSTPSCDSTVLNIPSGLYDINREEELSVFPNPVSSEVNIGLPAELYSNDQERIGCKIYNRNGILVEQSHIVDQQLNCSQLPTGLYFGIVGDSEMQYSFKFIKD